MWSERLLGLDPSPTPGHVFSIGRERLRYAFFGRENGSFVLREHDSEELRFEAFAGGPLGGAVRDIDDFTQAVGSLVGRLSSPPEEASVVVPDQWLRVVFTDIESIPRGASREDVLRFKLRRLVPFRVEDLRVDAVEVPQVDGRGSGRRFLLGFGLETLMAQLEATFDQHDVVAGQISNEGLSLLPTLEPLLGGGLAGVVYVTPDSFTLIVTQSARPVLHRYKPLAGDLESRARLVPRDLALTRDYLRQEVKGRRLGELILVAPDGEQAAWKSWIEDAFEHPVRSVAEEWPELPGTVRGVPTWEIAPLLGAASRGVY